MSRVTELMAAVIRLPERTTAAKGVEDPDADLVCRAGRGDRVACALLVDRHLDRVTQLAWRMMGNRADAEEIAQEVFLRVWRHAGRWTPGKARFTTWLHRVTVNQCLDRCRRQRDVPLTVGDDLPDDGMTQEDALQERDVEAAVGAALARLPDRQRAAVVLTHFNGLSNQEAAVALNVSVEAVESLLVRGRRRLRDLLHPKINDLMGGS